MSLIKILEEEIKDKKIITYSRLVDLCNIEEYKVETATRKMRLLVEKNTDEEGFKSIRQEFKGNAIIAYHWQNKLEQSTII